MVEGIVDPPKVLRASPREIGGDLQAQTERSYRDAERTIEECHDFVEGVDRGSEIHAYGSLKASRSPRTRSAESVGGEQEGLSAEQVNRAARLLFIMQKATARLYTARSMSSLPEEIAEWWTQYREAEAQLHRIITFRGFVTRPCASGGGEPLRGISHSLAYCRVTSGVEACSPRTLLRQWGCDVLVWEAVASQRVTPRPCVTFG